MGMNELLYLYSPSTKTLPTVVSEANRPFRVAILLLVPTKDVLVPGWEREHFDYVHRRGRRVGRSQVKYTRYHRQRCIRT